MSLQSNYFDMQTAESLYYNHVHNIITIINGRSDSTSNLILIL